MKNEFLIWRHHATLIVAGWLWMELWKMRQDETGTQRLTWACLLRLIDGDNHLKSLSPCQVSGPGYNHCNWFLIWLDNFEHSFEDTIFLIFIMQLPSKHQHIRSNFPILLKQVLIHFLSKRSLNSKCWDHCRSDI